MINIEQIRSEVKRARSQYDEEDRRGKSPEPFEGFLHYRDRNIVLRFEYLLQELDLTRKKFNEQFMRLQSYEIHLQQIKEEIKLLRQAE